MRRLHVLVGLAFLTGACGPSMTSSLRFSDIVADTAHFPLSFSSALVDESGIVKGSDLHVVGKLAHSASVCEGGKLDVSDAINGQIVAAGGEGVIDLRIETQRGGKCAAVKISGSIVRR